MNAAIYEKVRSIAADMLQVKIATLKADSSPETVDTWDSVHHLNLVLALEESFGFQFSPEEMDQMKTIGQIAGMVETKTGS
ncbi:MAG: acyl carrier protein [Bryobacteraceae bacterium]